MLFFAASVALVACKKEVLTEEMAFQKGQTVTISASAGTEDNSEEKVTGYNPLDSHWITYKWDDGDEIQVITSAGKATFSMVEKSDTAASFTGQMPGSGNTFSVRYPVGEIDLSEQSYTSGTKFGKGKMLFEAKDCVVGEPVLLQPQYSVLKLNIRNSDYDNAVYVTDIHAIIQDLEGTELATYKLNTGEEKRIGAGQAYWYHIIVNPRDGVKLKVVLYNGADVIWSKTSSNSVDFKKANFLYMGEITLN